MNKHIQSIIHGLLRQAEGIPEQFDPDNHESRAVAGSLNAGFLITLTDGLHPETSPAKQFLSRMRGTPAWHDLATFYEKAGEWVRDEIRDVCINNPDFRKRLISLASWMTGRNGSETREEMKERVWSVFFPEANHMLTNRDDRIEALRKKRTATVTELNRTPITNPAGQILFTSNVLLIVPPESKPVSGLSVSDRLKEKLTHVCRERQLYWYDHPVQVGVEREKNEILYGLNGLEEMVKFERNRGNIPKGGRLTCLLSVSVTHEGLHDVTKRYLRELLRDEGSMDHLDIYVFTEKDARRLVQEVLSPAGKRYLQGGDSAELLGVFGVDGEYGRHYSFLKAVSAFWNIMIDPEIRATFKIDLDQVFPQEELVEQTGLSAFGHLKSPLWGASGLDARGDPLEMGMIAGALVNNTDIQKSLFTPDVRFPEGDISPDEYIFFSRLPQALSTEAEMMTRYGDTWLDGRKRCIQRIHVTGGTNGILVRSLRRHRPFTPSFMGRAEDQAYILSVLSGPGERLAYVHKDGLIMRHDKEAFAQEAIQSAHISKLIGDCVRILYFSAYARSLPMEIAELKDILDPFTGCFVSLIPLSVVCLRFAFKAASFFAEGRQDQALEFLRTGAPRIMEAVEFTQGRDSRLKKHVDMERRGWNLYYDILGALETGLKKQESFALGLKKKAMNIVSACLIHGRRPER